MAFATRFRIATEKEKVVAVARLVKASTGDFDFYLFAILGVVMATVGLLLNSPEVIIGSMLIAPVLYPMLSLGLALVLSDGALLWRSVRTICISLVVAVVVSFMATMVFDVFGNYSATTQLTARAVPSALFFFVALVSGFAASYALVHANLNEMLPGVAISVALVPPLAAVGVGLALADVSVAGGAFGLFVLNVAGITLASMIAFTLMDLHGTHRIVGSAIKQEEFRLEKEEKRVKEIVKNYDHKN